MRTVMGGRGSPVCRRRRSLTRVVLVPALAVLSACGPAAEAPELREAGRSTLAESGASNPTVALSDDGALVTWVATEGGTHSVQLVEVIGEGEAVLAGTASGVNDVPGGVAPHEQAPAQVVGGPDGQVFVVWQNNRAVEGRRFPASDLRLAGSRDGGRSFEPAIQVNDDAGGAPTSHTFHDAAVASDGALYVSWIDGRDPGGPQIRVARSTDGGATFESSVLVGEGACPCCRTALAVGPAGEVYVAWRQVFEGNVRDMVVARSVDGGRSFGAPVRVHEDRWVIDGCPHAGPGLAVDASGSLHVAWFTGAPGRAGLYLTRSDDWGRFRDPVPLTPSGRTPVAQVKLESAGEDVWVAWEHPTPDGPVIRVASVQPEGLREVPWRSPPGRLPELAADSDELLVVWLDRDAVRLARFVSPGA